MGESKNTLYFGDNLDILRRYVKDETIDLVYLDPPFKSSRDYNVLFQERTGTGSAAQIKAFEDTWQWDESAAAAYHEVTERGQGRVPDVMRAFKVFLRESDMMAYLSMMAPRLTDLRRVLREHGSIYLHCDPAASHYLKVLMDAVFGPTNFRNEIIWRRSNPHGNVSKAYGSIHDVILFYTKGDAYTWTKPHKPYFLPDGSLDPETKDQVLSQYKMVDEETGRLFQATSLLNPNPDRPNLTYEFHGHTKVWRWTRERMEQAEKQGRLYFPRKGKGIPREKRFLDEQEGFPLQDIWTDIAPIPAQSEERLHYPTQKPEALLERIISASSNEGDTVLDPFCGCGTTIAVAQKLKRCWVGIDITPLAINLIRHRLRPVLAKGEEMPTVVGEPVSLPDAKALAKQDRFHFQVWALGLVEARATEIRKGADRGVDGRLYFHERVGGETKLIVLSVKSGKLKATDVRDLRAVIERDKAAIGVLIALEPPTKQMRKEAASAGFYEPDWGSRKYARLQIRTVEELLGGKGIEYPTAINVTYNDAPAPKEGKKQKKLFD